MKIKVILFILPLVLMVMSSCEKETYEQDSFVGLWQLASVSEDGIQMSLASQQESCQMLIEANGVYRFYHQSFMTYNDGDGPTSFFGTWSLLDDQWINFTTDKWQFVATLSSDSNKVLLSYKTVNDVTMIDTLASVKRQWSMYHIQSRFTILNLSDTEMEIRIKTFEGEKKYALMFAPSPDDFIELKPMAKGKINYSPKLVTDDNYWTIRKEYQTLKTYVFRFTKETY